MQKIAIVLLTTVSIVTLVGCAEQAMSRSRIATPSTTAATTRLNMIPAGTSLQVRTNDPIVADSSAVGRPFSGEVAGDVVNSTNDVLIPKGSPVTFVVLSTSRGGIAGGGELQLGIQSINMNGTNYAVTGSDVEKGEGLGANKRTATMVGGGAVLGTLLGAIAGGGTGAAIGAAAGAAAGAGTQVLTQGKQINVPAESVLTFQLGQDLYLQRR